MVPHYITESTCSCSQPGKQSSQPPSLKITRFQFTDQIIKTADRGDSLWQKLTQTRALDNAAAGQGVLVLLAL